MINDIIMIKRKMVELYNKIGKEFNELNNILIRIEKEVIQNDKR